MKTAEYDRRRLGVISNAKRVRISKLQLSTDVFPSSKYRVVSSEISGAENFQKFVSRTKPSTCFSCLFSIFQDFDTNVVTTKKVELEARLKVKAMSEDLAHNFVLSLSLHQSQPF